MLFTLGIPRTFVMPLSHISRKLLPRATNPPADAQRFWIKFSTLVPAIEPTADAINVISPRGKRERTCQAKLFTSRPLTKISSPSPVAPLKFLQVLRAFLASGMGALLFFKDQDESRTTSVMYSLAHFSTVLLACLVFRNNELARLIKLRLILIFVWTLRFTIFSALFSLRDTLH